jgi:hypothetical protein
MKTNKINFLEYLEGHFEGQIEENGIKLAYIMFFNLGHQKWGINVYPHYWIDKTSFFAKKFHGTREEVEKEAIRYLRIKLAKDSLNITRIMDILGEHENQNNKKRKK